MTAHRTASLCPALGIIGKSAYLFHQRELNPRHEVAVSDQYVTISRNDRVGVGEAAAIAQNRRVIASVREPPALKIPDGVLLLLMAPLGLLVIEAV
jgi:hypothetical protein